MSALLAKIDSSLVPFTCIMGNLTDVTSLRIGKHVFILQAVYEIEEFICLQTFSSVH